MIVSVKNEWGADAVATIAENHAATKSRTDILSGTPRAGAVDRWIYVFTAASFVVTPWSGHSRSLMRMAAIEAGERRPSRSSRIACGVMGSFLMLLLAQTILAATGRINFIAGWA